jgi:uncharacterized DUF497 family protein
MTAYPAEFIGLKNPLNQYGVQSFDVINSSSTCLNTQITLVKKLIYNQHQHANGLEVNLSEHNLTFADLGTVNMRLQLDSKKNVLPSKQALASLLTSSAQLTTEDIEQLTAKLIDDNVHLKMMFYGEEHSNHKTPTLYAEANLVLSALSLQSASSEDNQWLELIIKSKELGTYWQQNWQETNVSFEDISTHAVKGFILVAETPSGKTLQSLMPDILDSIEKSELATEGMFIENFIRLGSIVISPSTSTNPQ